jgi:hypothetical protein
MAPIPPPVDKRTCAEIASELNAGLAAQYPGWPKDGPKQGVAALVQVCARFSELIIERINRVPDRNRMAFLSYLGGALLPPQPARVPLTFALAPGGVVPAVVPAGTWVSAGPAPGESTPVVFETESELVVVPASLDQLFVRTPEHDRYSNFSGVLNAPAENPVQVFTGDQQIEHSLFVGHSSFFGQHPLNELVVSFDIEEGGSQPQQAVTWEIWSGLHSIPLMPESDGTNGLTQSGDVVFRTIPIFPPATVAHKDGHWLRCRLLKPLSRPIIARSLTLERDVEQAGLLPQMAFTGTTKVDLSKDFFPLGERPRFGDALYLTNQAAFTLPEAQVTLRIAATNPAIGEGDVPVPRVNALGHAKVTWEYWDGSVWRELGTMSADEQVKNSVTLFSDTTRAFTASGEVSFRVPPDMQPVEVSGVRAMWIRARLSAGNYGEEAGYTVRESRPGVPEYVYKPATIVAPLLKKIEADIVLREIAQHPEFVIGYNDFAFQDITERLYGALENAPLSVPSADSAPALYLGFDPPARRGMLAVPMTIYFVFATGVHGFGDAEELGLQRVSWQFWNGEDWTPFGVVDGTAAFSYSGPVSFMVPATAQAKQEFGIRRFWLRVVLRGGSKDHTSPLRLVLLNTTTATQSMTLKNEVLGSSNGTPGQVFHTASRPVLEGEVLEVLKPAGSGVKDAELWTAWQSVPDFQASASSDLHYMLDRLTGEITFGDGIHGAIPPSGSGNIRLARYRTGGGLIGNKGVDTIIQLKTTVPYVRSVTNLEPASGGADAETLQQLVERAPKGLRHRSRAVTIEDFEDLAILASPAVARARCVPLINLLLDPDAKQTRPGVVSVVIVPRFSGHKPFPSVELLSRVRTYLQQRQCATLDLIVVGPEYVMVDVSLEIGVTTLEGTTELEFEVRKRLLQFMDPLSGGIDQLGWDFGRQPHRSDILSAIGSIARVDHIRTSRVAFREDRPGVSLTDRFLACPGDLQITFTLG